MKLLKKGVRLLLILLLLLGIATLIFYFTHKPDYDGTQELPNLTSAVDVYYDTYGIPHIYAKNEQDAFRALGYVHAQDRLWQMELLRRIGTGGLSEVFGAERMLQTDQFFLSLGIDDATQATLATSDPNSEMMQIAQAYVEGINEFVQEGATPIEFYMTGIEKREFSIADIYNTIGYMGFSFAMAHKTDPLLSEIKNKLGLAYLVDLEIDIDPSTTLLKNYQASKDTLQNSINEMVTSSLKNLPVPLFVGSNSWVIAPEKTKNGAVIFANDPHIGFSQPSVWYEAHISTPTYEKYGYHIAGMPFPLLGHDRNLAYGLTMFENDDVDFYYETNHPTDTTKYKTEDGWEEYEIISKIIKGKEGEEIPFMYKKTRHGPILNGIANQIQSEQPISMSWIYTQVENQLIAAVYGMSHAKNLGEFESALPKIHAPGLNVMYGDVEGNVAWWATAKLYSMPDSLNTKFILDGSEGKDERLGYLDFKENPQAINPPWNYVYSANNQPDTIAGKLYPGYYLPENRAKRIEQLLAPKNDWDRKAVEGMITDVNSSVNASIVANLMKSVQMERLSAMQKSELKNLIEWGGDYPLNSIGATIYHRWMYWFLKDTFEDELETALFDQFMTTHFHKRLIAPMAAKEQSVWWDNVFTKDVKETKANIVQASLEKALASLEKDFGLDHSTWTWDRVHTLEHPHPIGAAKVPFDALRKLFNVGPFPVPGSREVINNLAFAHNREGKYSVGAGPSTRRVIDFSDIENSQSILPTGQSGNPLSPHYQDQAKMFVKGEFRPMMLNEKGIKENAKSVLIFEPKK